MNALTPFFLLAMLANSASGSPENSLRWIDRLKATPVSQLDPSLPDQPFADWFSDLVKPAQATYEVNDCGERNGTSEERGKEFPLCVSASADVQPVRKLELNFVVATYVVPRSANEKPVEKPAKVGLFHGTLGPSKPQSKQPTRLIRKLGDLPALLHA